MSAKITLNGRGVVALSAARLAARCLVSKVTAARWIENGRIKTAKNGDCGETAYYFEDDVEQLRAENLNGIRMKLSAGAITTDERAALATAGLENLQEGLKQLHDMFGRLQAAEEKKRRASVGAK